MNYSESIRYLDNFSNWEKKAHTLKARFSLTKIRSLMKMMDYPQKKFRSIHVAGTVGKGSVCMMLEAALIESGCKTALYTSPHLNDIRERIRIGGRIISKKTFADAVSAVREHAGDDFDRYTYFEILTAAALNEFARAGIEVAVVETGLGGRLDATNIVAPFMSVITTIGWDHQHVLGYRLCDIAREKAGIIKRGGRVVSAPQHHSAMKIIRNAAEKKNSPLITAAPSRSVKLICRCSDMQTFRIKMENLGSFDVNLHMDGDFQKTNLAVAVGALGILEAEGYAISPESVQRALGGLTFPGRMEWLRPTADTHEYLLDGAHNATAARALAQHIVRHVRPGRKNFALIIGVMKDKDADETLEALGAIGDDVIVCGMPYERARSPESLAAIAGKYFKNVSMAQSVPDAISLARRRTGRNALICVTGSLYAVADARAFLNA